MLICLLILLSHSVQPSVKSQKNSREKCAYVYEACHTICPSPPRKRQYILFYGEHKFPILYCVWELHSHMVLHLWCMTRLTILHLLYSTLQVTRAVQKSWLWQRGSLYISLSVWLPLCIPLHASMKSVFIPLCECIATRCTPSSSLGGDVGMNVHSWTFSPTCRCTRMCAHIHTNPLILPPVLLSISVGSGVVGVDGCWQGLDCWGKDDGGSCWDKIAVSWDPLEIVIRLLWNLLPIKALLKQGGGYS